MDWENVNPQTSTKVISRGFKWLVKVSPKCGLPSFEFCGQKTNQALEKAYVEGKVEIKTDNTGTINLHRFTASSKDKEKPLIRVEVFDTHSKLSLLYMFDY